MKHNIENIIIRNRNRLDVEKTDQEALWERIENELVSSQKGKQRLIVKIAAIIIVFLTLACVVLFNVFNASPKTLSGREFDGFPEFAALHLKYSSEIERKWQQIENYDFNKDDFPWITRELELLDQIREDYLTDYHTFGAKPMILKALLRYYENKARVLDQFINDLEKVNNNKNRRFYNEKNT